MYFGSSWTERLYLYSLWYRHVILTEVEFLCCRKDVSNSGRLAHITFHRWGTISRTVLKSKFLVSIFLKSLLSLYTIKYPLSRKYIFVKEKKKLSKDLSNPHTTYLKFLIEHAIAMRGVWSLLIHVKSDIFRYQQSFHGIDLTSIRSAAVEEYFKQPVVVIILYLYTLYLIVLITLISCYFRIHYSRLIYSRNFRGISILSAKMLQYWFSYFFI